MVKCRSHVQWVAIEPSDSPPASKPFWKHWGGLDVSPSSLAKNQSIGLQMSHRSVQSNFQFLDTISSFSGSHCWIFLQVIVDESRHLASSKQCWIAVLGIIKIDKLQMH